MGKKLEWILIFVMINFMAVPVFGLLNPSMVYCEQLGYNFTTSEVEAGEMGFCQFPDGSTCGAWDFLEGKCGEEHSYCKLEGYEMKTVSDVDKCSSIFSEECAVCVLENGTEIEVTRLMELDFREGKCGDGICALGEDYGNCPQDCPSGSDDGYCDGVADETCDPDCGIEEDPDCSFCGDGICNVEYGESYSNCAEDCPHCGNDDCEPQLDENYKNCHQDCPSGSEDNYCDEVYDEVCDPDCSPEEDRDCAGKPPALQMPWIYIVTGGVIAFLIIAFLIGIRKRSTEAEYYRS